ncbi:PREDICTED: uncharacterized protein LOC109221182 [Nicotiana attenuata]|uniref:uncharacterized protein LOC109221182 n=1 Tax=Nicotiana attenuata TaxID=49451 RepID=UPI000905A394|nr:PREDICTED: uncharacterized protein LOC109221182 [Nicotiana attenuata]
MTIKLVDREYTLNAVSGYAPYAGLDERLKGASRKGWMRLCVERRSTSLLDFVEVFEMVIANSSFPKRKEHLVTFQSTVARNQMDYILFRRYDGGCVRTARLSRGRSSQRSIGS